MDIDYAKILKNALSRGGEYADLYIENTRPSALVLEDRKVEKVLTGIETGAGLRVIVDFRTIYAYTNDLTERALLALAEKVAAASTGGGGDIVINLTERRAGVEFAIIEPPDGVGVDRKVALLKEADDAARSYDSRIAQATISYRDTLQDVVIACSDGTLARDRR